MSTSDPASAAAALVRDSGGPYVIYERDQRWTVASGARVELRLDRDRIRLHTPTGDRDIAVGPDPLRQVADLLAGLEIPGWSAYGWAAFELAHLLRGDRDRAGPATLLHLLVPEEAVVIGSGSGAASGPDVAPPVAWPAPGAELDVTLTGGARYRDAVAAAVRDIRDDKLQKVILSRIVPVAGGIDLLATYVAGRAGNTPARSFVLELGGLAAAGFSPETVVEVAADGRVSTQPLAGTRMLVGDPVIDVARREELLADPKEIYEHAISVRLAQDELAGVCSAGSVRVDEFMTVQERGSVQHLASRVSGHLAAGYDAWDAFAALFPSITASGIPKAAAYDLIARYEEGPRGLYSGAVLALSADGAFDAALVLRTVFVQDGRTWLRAGAGIVAPSTPEREWDETCEKLRSLSRFLVRAAPAGGQAPVPSRERGSRERGSQGGRYAIDFTMEGLRHTAAGLTEGDPATIGVNTNLFELGLASIALMQLVGSWRRAGVEVEFAELSENPTLEGWAKLLRERRPATTA
ncbi:salicylate synthase [Pseudonocardia sp. GCM10023141]|uniref:salicylate synthase n=1 Tax=Pseudonocardia sp. GCM10023141 TaxID=3252653 RepID=UPI00360BFAEC